MMVRCGTDSCTVCRSSAPGCKNRCTWASISPGSNVRSPRSMTSAPSGCLTTGPASAIRPPCTSTSPGVTTRPFRMSSKCAACSTTVGGEAGWDCPAAGRNKPENRITRNDTERERGPLMLGRRDGTTLNYQRARNLTGCASVPDAMRPCVTHRSVCRY